MKKQRNICIIISIILFILGLLYTTILTDGLAIMKIFNISLVIPNKLEYTMLLIKLIYKIIVTILSVILIIQSQNYSKEYKKQIGKSPNGYGLMLIGSILNIIGIWLGYVLNIIGVIFAILNKNKI